MFFNLTHPWVHEGGHGEVDKNKEGDDTLEDRDSIPVLLQNVPFDTREVEEQGRGAQQEQPCKCGRKELGFRFAFWHFAPPLPLLHLSSRLRIEHELLGRWTKLSQERNSSPPSTCFLTASPPKKQTSPQACIPLPLPFHPEAGMHHLHIVLNDRVG